VFVSFMQHHPSYLQIRLITRSHYGLERLRIDRTPDGVVVVPDDELQEKGQFAYVFDALAVSPGRVYFSPIVINHEDGTHLAEGKPTVRIAAPVTEPNGTSVGVLVIDLDLTKVFDRLAADLPADYRVFMANQWGDFLIHPNPALTFGFERGQRVLMQDAFPATKPLFDASSRSTAISSLLRSPDEAQVVAFSRTPLGASEFSRFVVLGLSRPLHDVLLAADALGDRIVRMVLVSSVLALLLAVLFARALTKPLHTLARAASCVFDEPATERLPVERSDEIGILARRFDSMRREIRSQMTALHAKQRELTHLARHDALTGLPNRILFMEKLEAAIWDASAMGEGLAVIFIDLDRFKEINDQLGHWAGDRALVVVAERLLKVLRTNDIAARLGGDEFIVLIANVRSAEIVEQIAARIAAAMDEDIEFGQQCVKVGASIGISEFPLDGSSAEQLLLKADMAMYSAKSSKCGSHRRYRELVLTDLSHMAPPGEAA
jgi:diguanylate cyclase (GGDEF)-like protein